MPTPVSAARQCLTSEAASALDNAVAVARRRGHAQTTSLHMVSSLLSLPRSSLREACTRTRNNAYSTRVQFKALELSLSVSLDRLPSSQAGKIEEEPPVSNSLMAAIKRSQASQRRQPENYSYYQQQQQQYTSCSSSSPSSVPVVKVELQNFIISILDDPLVSRVFGEAGFRSCDIKLATLRPGNSYNAHHLFGYSSRYKRGMMMPPPLFLCNLAANNGSENITTTSTSENITTGSGRGFSFPFMGCFAGDENSRRIGEIMSRDKKRSPLLLGVTAGDALASFLETVQKRTTKQVVLPEGLKGVTVVSIKDEIVSYLNGNNGGDDSLQKRFGEVESVVGGGGVVVNFGDLNELGGDGVGGMMDRMRHLVKKLAELVEAHKGKVWLIGAVATHEIHSMVLGKFPTIEEDWDLQVLPINLAASLKFSVGGGSNPRSSLMGSFVPLGGFFSMPSETRSPMSNTWQYVSRCHLCNEKCEQEVAALSNGGHYASIADRCKSSLPSWLQNTELSAQSSLASIKGKDDTVLLNAKIVGIRKKWDGICQQHHFNKAFSKGMTPQLGYQFPRVLGFQVIGDGKGDASCDRSNHSNEASNEAGNKNVLSSLSNDLIHSCSDRDVGSLDALSKANNKSISSKSGEIPSESRGEPVACRSQHFDSLCADVNDDRTSPTTITSVTTDLGLRVAVSASNSREPVDQSRFNPREDSFAHGISSCQLQASSCFDNDSHINFAVKDPKSLYKALVERVGQQEDAISSIVETITQCQTKNPTLHGGMSRRSIWINCQGPDNLGKRKLGVALAEILYGSKESLIYADLSFQDENCRATNLINSQVTNKYDITMRGTVVDYLVEKLGRKPCVVFIANIDKADMVVQNCLSQAMKTDRFTDLRGRQVTISNCVFLLTTKFTEGADRLYSEEEDIMRTQGSSIQILVRFDLNSGTSNLNMHQSDDATRKGCSDLCLMNKRKLASHIRTADQQENMEVNKRQRDVCLDLNLPAEGSEICNTLSIESESDSSSESHRSSWLEDFNQQMDKMVVFKPFDFDSLTERLCKDMTNFLHNVSGSECAMEIEPKVMNQLLAAAYLHGKEWVEDWIRQVLGRGFAAAVEKFGLNDCSIVKIDTCEDTCDDLLPSSVVVK